MATTRERRKAAAARRTDRPPNFWRAGRRVTRITEEEFRVIGVLGGGKTKVLDDIVESITWTDDADNRTSGTITLHRPGNTPDKGKIGIGKGHRIQLYKRARWGTGPWKPVWRMYVKEVAKNLTEHQYEYTLTDESWWLRQSEDSWKYGRSKSHRRGWKPHQIVRSVCRRYGVKMSRRIYRGRYYVRNLHRDNASPWEILTEAYKRERRITGKKFIVRMSNGKLEVVPLTYSPYLYEMGDLVLQGTVTERMSADFASALTVRATASRKKGRRKRKISVRYSSRGLIKRYGRIHKTIRVDADSRAEARKEAKRWLKKKAEGKREITFTHPGITDVRRGTAMRLYFPTLSLRQVVFVREVTHNVTPGDYSMDITVRFDDPYKDEREERAKAKRCAVARRRGRPAPKGCPQVGAKKPRNRRRRANA